MPFMVSFQKFQSVVAEVVAQLVEYLPRMLKAWDLTPGTT